MSTEDPHNLRKRRRKSANPPHGTKRIKSNTEGTETSVETNISREELSETERLKVSQAEVEPNKKEPSPGPKHPKDERTNMETAIEPHTATNGISRPSMNGESEENASNSIEAKRGKGKNVMLEEEGSSKPEASKRRSQTKLNMLDETVEGVNTRTDVTVSKRTRNSLDHDSRLTLSKRPAWTISNAFGGRFLPLDPVFTVDEKYLLLATKRGVHAYSTSTSLLVRILRISPTQSLTNFVLSATNKYHLYTATSSGDVTLWDWTKGEELNHWNIGSSIHSICAVSTEDSENDHIYTVEANLGPKAPEYHVVRHDFKPNQRSKTSKVTRIKTSLAPLHHLKVFRGGSLIFTASVNSLEIGTLGDGSMTSNGKSAEYRWNKLTFQDGIKSLDIVCDLSSSTKSQKTRPTTKISSADSQSIQVAIGSYGGAISVYEDIATFLYKPVELTPRILHWHRSAVSSAKWSRDGNYIISGGGETVLVLWQLDTGKRQALPHLTSAVEAITVSPSGASYAIRLADNSVIVVSTSELEPTAVVAGIQSQSRPGLVKRWNNPFTPELVGLRSTLRKTPSAFNPSNPNHLLLAVPAPQGGNQDTSIPLSTPFLETYDIAAARHVSRQALARNNTTNINVAPNATKISESNVTHVQVSADGRWLATAEEWMPPRSNLEFLISDDDTALEEQFARRETYLKFWMWDDERDQWILETRIDSPHQSDLHQSSNRILDLLAEPRANGFASVGEDGLVQLWRVKTRLRDGTVVRGGRSQGQIIWSSSRTVSLENTTQTVDFDGDVSSNGSLKLAKLAFSNDGSVLVVAQDGGLSRAAGVVQFIETASGTIKSSQSFMFVSGLAGLQFRGRHLIVLSDDLRVWDVVTNQLVYGFKLNLPPVSPADIINSSHLSVHGSADRFAIAHAVAGESDGDMRITLRSRILVFDPSEPEPLYTLELPNVVTVLMPLPASLGFVVIDAASEVRIVRPQTVASLDLEKAGEVADAELLTEVTVAENAADEMEVDEDDGLESNEMGMNSSEDEDYEDDDNKPVVRQEQLARIFDDGPSFALPPVQQLFEAVAGLYARKPERTEATSSA